jgi:hypothetical protein
MSSRYVYSVALKNKKEGEVLNGFKNIYGIINLKLEQSGVIMVVSLLTRNLRII